MTQIDYSLPAADAYPRVEAQTGKSGTSAGRAAAPAEPAVVARRWCGRRL